MEYKIVKKQIKKARSANANRAFSLLEMIVVLTIMGVFSAMAVTTFGHDALANAAAKGYARRLAVDLLQAQRRSIGSGNNFQIAFQTSGSNIISHTLFEKTTPSTTIVVDDARAVPSNVTVTSAQSMCEYTFEGSTTTGFTCTVAGPDRSWQVTVIQVTGHVKVTEL